MLILKEDLEELIEEKYKDYDAIVVEGYDSVGKGRILEILSSILNVEPYRPDYNLWQQFDHRKIDRWKISGFFWDVYSHFNHHSGIPMLFDRGVISGAVYNHDSKIAENYKKLLGEMKVFHIMVECYHDDYVKFSHIRNPEISDKEVAEEWEKCVSYNHEYLSMFNKAGVEYAILVNNYEEEIASSLYDTCEGCGHYSYGFCRHPLMNCLIDKSHKRCGFSVDKEVQDRDVAEMHSL